MAASAPRVGGGRGEGGGGAGAGAGGERGWVWTVAGAGVRVGTRLGESRSVPLADVPGGLDLTPEAN